MFATHHMQKRFSVRIVVLFVLAFFAIRFSTHASEIESVTGLLENPEYAFDGAPDTAATLTRAPNDDFFEIIIYLNDPVKIISVSVTISSGLESASMQASPDIVSWEDIPAAISQTPEGQYNKLRLSAEEPFTAKYLRIRFNAKEAEKLSINEAEVTTASFEQNEITDIQVESATETQAVITYKTTFPAATQIRYGALKPVFNNVHVVREQVTDHRAALDNLLAGTNYFYQVVLEEPGAGSKTSKVLVFRTAGEPLPLITRINLPDPGPTSASLEMEANTAVSWKLRYGIYLPELSLDQILGSTGVKSAEQAGPAQAVTMDLENLQPRTRYFFMVTATDSSGRETTSDLLGFDTAPLDLALGKPATGTFTYELEDEYIQKTDNPIRRITDGDENYHTGFAKAPPTGEAQWVRVDLGGTEAADEVVVVWSALAAPLDYTLSASVDGETWERLFEVKGGEPGKETAVTNKYSARGDPLLELTFHALRDLRFLKLEIPAGAPIDSRFGWKTPILAEIRVLAPAPQNK